MTALSDGVCILVFGATGDLARRKLYPALYRLYRRGRLHDRFVVIGIARRMRTKAQYEDDVRRTLTSFVTNAPDEAVHIQQFATHFTYFSLDIADRARFLQLASYAHECDEQYHTAGNRMYYLALAPELFERVTAQIVQSGLRASAGWQRLIIEKPFGYDLASATALQRHVREAFAEHEIFRIDHYLGKTFLRTLYDLRFHNIFLAPLWNRQGIAHVQITLSESLGVEERGSYYESSGALRDMVQNHILQLIAFLAMCRPTATTPTALRQATTAVLRALIPYADEEDVRRHVVRGQYIAGVVDQQPVCAYIAEEHVSPHSTTETFVAAKIRIDDPQWHGVPFYVRTGKRLQKKETEIIVTFHPHMQGELSSSRSGQATPSQLRIGEHPLDVSWTCHLPSWRAGAQTTSMKLHFPVATGETDLSQKNDAYERLIEEALDGDATYFVHWDEVAASWSFIDSITRVWHKDPTDLTTYVAGTKGPVASDLLLQQDGDDWYDANTLLEATTVSQSTQAGKESCV